VLETSTAQIARESNVAHGTIFLHFRTKDELVEQVFVERLRLAAIELDARYEEEWSFEQLVGVFLDYVAENEQLFEVYCRELPQFGIGVKPAVLSFELTVRDSFFKSLRDERVPEVSIPLLLNLLFAQLSYYYGLADVLCGSGSVIDTYGPRIRELLVRIVKSGGVELEEKICQSCGMPMSRPEDFGGGDVTNIYCVHCTDAQGVLKPYEVKLEEMAQFIASRSGATIEAARVTAAENMARMPAWSTR
jgi:AcrR family transcriptional regulator